MLLQKSNHSTSEFLDTIRMQIDSTKCPSSRAKVVIKLQLDCGAGALFECYINMRSIIFNLIIRFEWLRAEWEWSLVGPVKHSAECELEYATICDTDVRSIVIKHTLFAFICNKICLGHQALIRNNKEQNDRICGSTKDLVHSLAHKWVMQSTLNMLLFHTIFVQNKWEKIWRQKEHIYIQKYSVHGSQTIATIHWQCVWDRRSKNYTKRKLQNNATHRDQFKYTFT